MGMVIMKNKFRFSDRRQFGLFLIVFHTFNYSQIFGLRIISIKLSREEICGIVILKE